MFGLFQWFTCTRTIVSSSSCLGGAMVKILVAKTAGFCWGVSRAIDLVMNAANEGHVPIYTDGALIHNPQVLQVLESSQIHVTSAVENVSSGTIAIRAHGITPERRLQLKKKGLKIVDA